MLEKKKTDAVSATKWIKKQTKFSEKMEKNRILGSLLEEKHGTDSMIALPTINSKFYALY